MTNLKFGVFVHPIRPKIAADKILKRLRSLKVACSQEHPDIGIVVGGDGTFGYYGRTLSIPLLFVGVQEREFVGSKAKLAQIFYNEFDRAICEIKAGKHSVVEVAMLAAELRGRKIDVLTDVYLERGAFSGCLRYGVTVMPSAKGSSPVLDDYAIGNGVIVCTAFGAGGYFSHPDRLRSSAEKHDLPFHFPTDQIGVCHILPTYLVRKTADQTIEHAEVKYVVPNDSIIRIKLLRDVEARFYGTTKHSRGVVVRPSDTITIRRSDRSAKIIKL